MVDVDTRKSTAGEQEPVAPMLSSSRANFDMGIEGARDYKALLAGGVAREHPGAPVPYAGGAGVAASFYGTNNEDTAVPAPATEMQHRYDIPSGIHRDPMATWINDGSVPAGTTGYAGFNVRPQGMTAARLQQFAAGEQD